MKANEIRELGVDELRTREKDLARIKTILREKQG
jgi:ribosomal protein L29